MSDLPLAFKIKHLHEVAGFGKSMFHRQGTLWIGLRRHMDHGLRLSILSLIEGIIPRFNLDYPDLRLHVSQRLFFIVNRSYYPAHSRDLLAEPLRH
jgi:hypothetical protein